MANVTLTEEEYRAFVALSRDGKDAQKILEIEAFAKSIEERNGIKRYFVLVQWQEAGQPLPVGAVFPSSWPPQLRAPIELSRPIAKSDVELLLQQRAIKPVTILVTRDPAGVVGWTGIDQFFA